MIQRKYISFLLFIVFVVAIYTFQILGVKPFVEDVATSDFFLKESDDKGPLGLTKSPMTEMALTQCKKHLVENFDSAETASFSNKDYKSWSLGDFTYVINYNVLVSDPAEGLVEKDMLCKIHFTGGDKFDYDNWEVTGFNFK